MKYPHTLEDMEVEEVQRLFELYHSYCLQHDQTPSVKDFVLWYGESYGE